MGEFLGILLYLGFILAFVALIGHGIWLAVAWLVAHADGTEAGSQGPPLSGVW